MSGFPVVTVDNVLVTQGSIYTLPVKLQMSQQATTVEVSAQRCRWTRTTCDTDNQCDREDLQTMPPKWPRLYAVNSTGAGIRGIFGGWIRLLKRHASQSVNWQI